jgi:hypothetical protein
MVDLGAEDAALLEAGSAAERAKNPTAADRRPAMARFMSVFGEIEDRRRNYDDASYYTH